MPIASELSVTTGVTADDLATTIFGSGISIVPGTASITGAATAFGTYTGGDATLGELAPGDSGVILSTGNVADFTNSTGDLDTNTAPGTTTGHGTAGDADLDAQTGQTTFDAVVLEADFTPVGDFITMQFVFSSEEYLEYVNGGVNDAFGVWVNDAYVPFTPATNDLVSIDTINNVSSSNLYLDNPADADTYNTEMDGATIVLSIKAPVISGASNSIKIALGDGGDSSFDSNVLIAANSVQTIALAFDDAVTMETNSNLTVDVLSNDIDQTGGGLTITEINGQSVVAGGTVTLPTGEVITLNADNTLTILSDGDVGSEPFTYAVVDSAGNTDVGFVTINTVADIAPDFIVEGTSGDDTIDGTYTLDPEGDLVDANDNAAGNNNDSIQAGAGDDVINAGLGADTVDAGTGNDSVLAGSGADSVIAGAGADTIFGEEGNDTILGGAGADSLDGDGGNDSIDGGADDDTLIGDAGNDTLLGGSGNDSIFVASGANSIDGGSGTDQIFGGSDADTIDGGTDADTLSGAGGDDVFALENDFGADQITGGETGETGGDTLDLSAITDDLTIDLTSADPEAGTLSDGVDTASFSEIESITLGGGRDTIVLADGSGGDTVDAFDLTDSGDGTSNDQLDVSGLTSDGGTTPVTTDDVVVTDDGSGNAVLTFPGGESLTLTGVAPTAVDSPAELEAIGIPAAAPSATVTIHDAIILDAIPGGTDLLSSGSELQSVSDALTFDVATPDELNTGDTVTISGTVYTVSELYTYEADLTNSGGAFPGTETVSGVMVELDDGVGGTLSFMLLDDSFGDKESITEAQMIFITPGATSVDTTVFDTDDTVTLGTPPAGNFIVEGTAGADTIEAGTYLDDPQGDEIDNLDAADGSNDDIVLAGGGDDSVNAGLGNDSVDGGTGNDTIFGAAGNDTIIGGAGADSIAGNEDDDSLVGGIGNDTLEGEDGNDTLIGGAGDDSIIGAVGDDFMVAGAGNDFVRGSFGDDTLIGSDGDDTLWGGFGDDSIVVAADFGDYTIEGEEDEELTGGDTVDASAVTSDLAWDLTSANPEAGSFSDGTNTANFVDIENLILGAGTDTLELSTFGGSDTVSGFDAPTDTGGGTFSGNDQLDVTGLTDVDGNPTHTGNVTVSDDGSGNAVLTFVNGESLTLIGTAPSDVSTPAQLIAMGIPEGPDGFVDGTAGDDTIDVNYQGDPNFDRVDAEDAELPGAAPNDDYIRAGAGNDTVTANAGDDTVELGTGNDSADGGVGDDTLLGEAGDDSLIGGLGNDSLSGGADDDTLNGQIGDDVLDGGDGSDVFALEDDFGNDTIIGGEVDDAGGNGDELDMSGLGGALTYDLTGADSEAGTVTDGVGTATFSEIETITLSAGIDTIVLADGSGDDTVNGFTPPFDDGAGTWVGVDQVDVSAMTDANGALVNTGDVTITDDGAGNTVLTFPGGESLTLTGVPVTAFPVPEALAAIGIPLADYIVEGTAVGELIDETYFGDPEGDLVNAGDGDPLLADPDGDSIEAGGGADTITAGAGNDTVLGEDGDDLIDGGANDDTLIGGLGADTIEGGTGLDSVLGNEGDDSLTGGAGDDTVEGGIGNDTLVGGTGDDQIFGGDDADLITLGDGFGDDSIFGGEGGADNDTLDLSDVTTGVDIAFGGDEAGSVTDVVTGDGAEFSGIETLIGSGAADTIDASADTLGTDIDADGGNDSVTGGDGLDTIAGGAGDDTLGGGDGGDSIDGGTGDDLINVSQGDTVTGGDGDDFFSITDLGETDTGTISITGGEGDETDGDTLALNGLHDRDSLVITDPSDATGGLTGTVTLLDGTIVNFTNIENIICFVPGTMIATPFGLRAIEDLTVGDMVVTQDNGIQPIRWIGQSTVAGRDKFAPVRFDATIWPGSAGDLVVSPQHRVLFKGYQAELLFGQSEVLVPARHLIDGTKVQQIAQDQVTYVHIMFDRHEIIFANGIAAESFHPGELGVDALASAARNELFKIFPELRSDLGTYGPSARESLRQGEASLVKDLITNGY